MPQYDIDSGITNTITNTTKSFSFSEVWVIISILLAVVAGFFLFTTYFNKDKEKIYTGFKKKLYDFINFKITIIEPILKVLYLISALAITLNSLSYITVNFFQFIGMLVFGNLALRVTFELLLLCLKMFKDVSEINSKLSKKEKLPKPLIKKNIKKENEKEKLKEI